MKRLLFLLLLIPGLVFAVEPVYDYQTALEMETAWESAGSASTVKVAIIDFGFDRNYPDFGNITAFRNFYGASDPVYGDVVAGNTMGTGNHGTAIASILGAEHDGTGMKGAAPNVEMMLLRGFANVGSHGDYWSLFYSIKWAVDNGAKVISISTGERWPASGNVPTNATHQEYQARYQAAIDYMKSHDVYFATGSGNSADNLDDDSSFWVPAEMNNLSNLLCGLSTDYDGSAHPPSGSNSGLGEKPWYGTSVKTGNQTGTYASFVHAYTGNTAYFDEVWHEPMDEPEYYTGNLWWGANYGSICELAVPAEDVYGLSYQQGSGISLGTPIAAGLAAFIRGINPGLSALQVAAIMEDPANTDAISTIHPIGGKRINFRKAIQAAIATIPNRPVLAVKDFNKTELTLTNFQGDPVNWKAY